MIDRSFENNCTPKYFFDKLTDITRDDFERMGVKAIALDIDNTTAYDSVLTLIPGVREWVDKVRSWGFPMIIVSNTYTLRAKKIAKSSAECPISRTRKSLPRATLSVLRKCSE